jgi:hypothetical protein
MVDELQPVHLDAVLATAKANPPGRQDGAERAFVSRLSHLIGDAAELDPPGVAAASFGPGQPRPDAAWNWRVPCRTSSSGCSATSGHWRTC